MKKLTILYSLVTLVLCVLLGSPAHAATITAASCSCADIQNAIDTATNGDTIAVPAGMCTWTGTGCITIDKPIGLIGAGAGQTIINDSTVRGDNDPAPIIISFLSSANEAGRISGFTFHDSGAASSPALIYSNTNSYVRIDHIDFDGTKRRCTWLGGNGGRGVVDHCQFNSCSNIISPSGDYDAEWAKTTRLGSDDAWYFEDNTFHYSSGVPNIVDGQYGARFVLRYNNWIADGSMMGAFAMNHGYDSVCRGNMVMEVYHNTFDSTQAQRYNMSWAIQYRGGTGVVFNNTLLGYYNVPMGITNYRSCTDYVPVGYCTGGPKDGKACYTDQHCSGGTCTKKSCDGMGRFDGNAPGRFGYSCRDQIGRGGNQELIPLYEWNNTLNGAPVHFTAYNWAGQNCSNQDTYHIIENRDFYNNAMNPDYVPYIYPHPLTQTGARIYGDVSENGSVTAYDASLAAQYAVGGITLTQSQLTKAEVSGNGTVSAYDAALIAQFAAGLITGFPVEG